MSNVIISDDSMREMIRSINSQQRQIFDEVYNWCKSKCKYRNSLTIKKLTLSVFLYQEQQVWASCVLSISFFRHCQELSIFILAYQKRLKIAATGVAAVNIN